MSYILDALKKSEKERQRKALPDILTVQDIASEKPAKSYFWLYLLLVALAVNVGILAWWMASPNEERSAYQTPHVDVVSPPTTDVPSPSVAERTMSSPGSLLPVKTQLQQTEKVKVPVAVKVVPVRTERKPDPKEKMQAIQDVRKKIILDYSKTSGESKTTAEPSPEIAKQAVESVTILPVPASVHAEVPDPNRIYKLKDLPSSILKSLPTFSVSALLFAESPASRMVRVNDQMMHEGEDLAQGVRLMEITRDGLVFSYRKFRFYVAAK